MRNLWLALAGLAVSGTAQAAVIINLSGPTNGQISAGGDPLEDLVGPNINEVREEDGSLSRVSTIFNLTASGSEEANFLFKHDHFGFRTASGNAFTELSVELVNTSELETIPLIFVSQITPGHLATQTPAGSPASNASFRFEIELGDETLFLMDTELDGKTLLDSNANFLSFLQPSVFETETEIAYDWGAKNVVSQIGAIPGNESVTLTYRLTTFQSEASEDECAGAQVAFGDPRVRGGIDPSVALNFPSALAVEVPESVARQRVAQCDGGRLNPVIGLPFDPYLVTFQVFPRGTEVPQIPNPRPIDYTQVPAPGAMLLFGLGALALGAARRRLTN